jgi:organic radical activating enzyme
MHNITDEDPQDPRILVPNIEFYITNICNLTCKNCNRFNDYDFKGWQRWSDYESQYQQWSKHVRLQRVTILGGEPLLNPTICDWVDGINQFWQKPVQILSNGTRLNHVPDLYDRLVKFSVPGQRWKKNWIGISLHNENDRERCFDEIRKFLRGKITYVHKSDPRNADNSWTYGGQHAFVDQYGMRICVWEYDSFYRAAVQKNQHGKFTLFNNDAVQAHQGCGFAQFKCYHFIRAKLYKCGPVALFPEFDQQHTFDITDQDRLLLNSYLALSPDEFETRGQEFLSHIDDVIPQCKFCPTSADQSNEKIYAVNKKLGSVGQFE